MEPRVLYEAPDYKEVAEEELKAFIASRPSNEIAQEDYVSADSGEVMWEKGQRAGDTHYHPEAEERRETERLRKDSEWERNQLEWDSEYQLHRAIDEFVSKFGPDPDLGAPPEDAAADMAETFFLDYPNWKDWADDLDMNKWNVKDIVAERIYSVLIGEE